MRSVLVAARGAPAVRAVAVCRAIGITPVTVVTRSDPQRRHVLAGHVVLDAADCAATTRAGAGCGGYDCADCIVRAAVAAGVDAVHPGWGAVAEDPALARGLAERGIRFVGSPEAALTVVGDTAWAVETAERAGVPVLPHAVGRRMIRALVARHGLPVVLKRSRCRQGEGVRVVRRPAELFAALADHPDWYAEPYVEPARVVGVTVAVDDEGNAAHLCERESLLVAGNRKLLEAAPVHGVPDVLLAAMRADALRLACAFGLLNVVTVEFLVHAGGYTFQEVNPRLTGAYRIAEAVTGIDVIALQLGLAAGSRSIPADPLAGTHAVQGHLFLRPGPPASRVLRRVRLPAERPGVVVDCTLDMGQPVVLDTIAAQVLATGTSRAQAYDRVARAVGGLHLAGVRHHGADIARWCFRRSRALTEV
ncbi:biotin carboxylase N-terminal domain-containing protein [Lentzea sp.]|uniref:ATP-binding protein n=1 Tax=Lentzea sp. TaxID=56099 RepID=UPI002B7FB24B|nr:biotin carboxylase N-terminal domain-containing protein [Lentzea sp.]HUQ54813.1 biotin carboxylase N-terminal domain-containing protein [Lentzea sp.]